MFDWQTFSQKAQSIADSGHSGSTSKSRSKKRQRRSQPMAGQTGRRGNVQELVIVGDPNDLRLLANACEESGAQIDGDTIYLS